MQDKVVKSVGNCTMLENGLQFSGVVPFQEWERRGNELKTVIRVYTNNVAWWLGDWIIYGENNFKEKYSQALEGSMYTIGHLRNCVWVCRNVKQENRNPALSFQHHYEVAALDPAMQVEWLAKAELNHWTAKQLNHAIKGFKTEEKLEVTDRPEDIANNAISHSKPGMSFEEWYNREVLGLKMLSNRELAYTSWFAAIMSRAKQV